MSSTVCHLYTVQCTQVYACKDCFPSFQEHYETVGVACHRGTGLAAHWYAVFRQGKEWIMVSDSTVDVKESFEDICRKYGVKRDVDSIISKKRIQKCKRSNGMSMSVTSLMKSRPTGVKQEVSEGSQSPIKEVAVTNVANAEESRNNSAVISPCASSDDSSNESQYNQKKHIICRDCGFLVCRSQFLVHKQACAHA